MEKLDWTITNFEFYRNSLRSILGQVLNKKLKSQNAINSKIGRTLQTIKTFLLVLKYLRTKSLLGRWGWGSLYEPLRESPEPDQDKTCVGKRTCKIYIFQFLNSFQSFVYIEFLRNLKVLFPLRFQL